MTFDDMITKSPKLADFARQLWGTIAGDQPMPDQLIEDILEGMGDLSQHANIDAILSVFGFQLLCMRQLNGSFDCAEVGYQQLCATLQGTDPELLRALNGFVTTCSNIVANIDKYIEKQPVMDPKIVPFPKKKTRLY